MWFSTVISQLIAFFRGLILPNLLGPHLYGILGGLSLIPRYSGYLDLGFLPAMSREVPLLTGGGKMAQVERVKSVTFLVNLLSVLFYSLVLLGVAVALSGRFSSLTLWGIVAFVMIVIFTRLSDFYRNLFNSRGRFTVVSGLTILDAAGTLVLVLPIVYFFRLYGFYLGMVALAIIVFFVFYLLRQESVRLMFDKTEFWRLLKIGLPMFFWGIGGTVLMTLDRFFVIYYFSTTELGYYTIAGTISAFVFLLPVNVSRVLAQNLFLDYGASRSPELLREYITKTTLVLSVSLASLLALTTCAYPAVFHIFLPKYLPSVHTTFLLLLSVFFLGAIVSVANVLIALNRQLNIFFLQLVSIFITSALCYLAVSYQPVIEGIAASMVLGFLLYAGLLALYAFRLVSLPARLVWLFILEVTLPLLYSLAGLYLVVWLLPTPQAVGLDSVWLHLLRMACRLGLMFVILLPLLWFLERRTGIFKDLWHIFVRRRRERGA
jgi:O-antigen/teichoic acid export membrane protein